MKSMRLFLLTMTSILSIATSIRAISFEDPIKMHETDFVFEGTPTVVDWDNDGLVDVLFGERNPSGSRADLTFAKVSFWRNSGTESNPSFSNSGKIQAGEEDLCIGVG